MINTCPLVKAVRSFLSLSSSPEYQPLYLFRNHPAGKSEFQTSSQNYVFIAQLADNKPKLTTQAIKSWVHLGRRQSLYFPVRSCSHFQVRANSASEANKAKIKAGRVAPGPKRKTWSSCHRTTWKHLNTTIFNNFQYFVEFLAFSRISCILQNIQHLLEYLAYSRISRIFQNIQNFLQFLEYVCILFLFLPDVVTTWNC